MLTGRCPWILGCLVLLTSGCAQSGGFLSSRTTMGTLKSSLSHLEFENQQLKRQVASLKAEARDIENRLVQEEAANGELTARLDDARTILKQRGLDAGEPSVEEPQITRPAANSSRKRRKPPFAQIPGRIDDLPSEGDSDSLRNRRFRPLSSDPDAQSALDRPLLWLPVAQGATDPPPSRK